MGYRTSWMSRKRSVRSRLARLTEVVNIGSGQPVTVREVATQIADVIGRHDLLQFGGLSVSDHRRAGGAGGRHEIADGLATAD